MSSLIRQDLVPVATGYVLVMGALAAGLWLIRRRGEAGAAGPPDRDLAHPRRAARPPVAPERPPPPRACRAVRLARVSPGRHEPRRSMWPSIR